ncbi:helix-turn-helix domain-containing protein [Uliginosibacterium sp. 31-12]|uniref:helix-turn-helix domain-containing protein n=1 Tax=Uliginosibacterium sp. 31-12 TaxID=3062781 RepID=UPI0026E20F0E|nr:helix-turn-helix transcriptional regulator [Uliginosibacterium sp. 31-12]MDO6386660.1 helix-turn-helix transcriptional regulator [Uliginosibacterium sp. 31-12]
MDLIMNGQQIRKLREARAWSQEHLAAAAGLSLRTIQRVEAEGKASAETRLALAGAFGVELALLTAQEASAPAPVQEPTRWQLSRAQYQLLRLALVLTGVVGVDLYRHASLTWSRWVLLGAVLVLGLRWFKRHFVAPREI